MTSQSAADLVASLRVMRRLLRAVLVVAGVVLCGTLGYVLIEGWPLLDALYMTVITVATVGYGETLPLSPAGRIYTMLLIAGGATGMIYLAAAATSFIFEAEMTDLFRRKRMEKRIQTLRGHYLVCGAGSTGRHVIDELQRTRRDFVVVEQDTARIARLVGQGILCVHGDATLDETLLEAGVARAAGLATALRSDADNVLVALTARRLNAQLRIVAKADAENTKEKLHQVGADGAVMTAHIGGMRMVSELVRPSVVTFLDVMLRDKDKNIRIEEIHVGANAAGRTLRQLGVADAAGASVVALLDAGEYRFNPPADSLLAAGQTIIMLGRSETIQGLQQRVAAFAA